MSNIDNYYRFKKEPENKTVYRLEFFNGMYEGLHKPNKRGEIKLCFSDYCYVKSHAARKSDYSISQNSKHISQVFFPSIEFPNLAFGDFENDFLLFIIQGKTFEILVLKDKKPFTDMLFNMLQNGAFDELIEKFREQS